MRRRRRGVSSCCCCCKRSAAACLGSRPSHADKWVEGGRDRRGPEQGARRGDVPPAGLELGKLQERAVVGRGERCCCCWRRRRRRIRRKRRRRRRRRRLFLLLLHPRPQRPRVELRGPVEIPGPLLERRPFPQQARERGRGRRRSRSRSRRAPLLVLPLLVPLERRDCRAEHLAGARGVARGLAEAGEGLGAPRGSGDVVIDRRRRRKSGRRRGRSLGGKQRRRRARLCRRRRRFGAVVVALPLF